MTHETKDMTPAELRKFGLITGAIIILFIGGFLPWWWDRNIWHWQQVTLPLGGVLIAWALAHPASMIYFYKPWMKLAEGLGFINTRIILFIVFYGLFLPMGVVMRLFGKDPMQRKMETAAGS
ncbi:MAG TPA: SxtJ family membrane protein, partial [Pseudomonadales bacterium]|nr:SxtJ family membrane protein [Pseudomonadales bacterium]